MLLGSILFIFINLLFFGLGIWYLKSAVKGIESSNFENVAQDAKQSRFFLSTIKPTANISFDLLGIVGLDRNAQKAYYILDRVVELSEIVGSTFSQVFAIQTITAKRLTSMASVPLSPSHGSPYDRPESRSRD